MRAALTRRGVPRTYLLYLGNLHPVSYTHLDVYKRQVLDLQGMNTMRPWRVALAEYLYTEFAELTRSVAVA